MMRPAHWGWVLLLMLVAAVAVVVNANSRRIFILQEGSASHPISQAFFAGADGVLRRLSHLKARYQYLNAGRDACREALAQIASFSPDVVIAEGLQARHCVAQRAPDKVQMISEPAIYRNAQGYGAFVAAWAAVLADLSAQGHSVSLVHGDDPDGLAERELLVQAATRAGLEIQALAATANGETHRTLAAALGKLDSLVVVGHTVGDGAPAGKAQSRRALFAALQAATPQPILATQLSSVYLGADMALEQAPEQRGEQMALAALRGHSTDAATPPLEMAVALNGEFAERMGAALPAFYRASARLSGFVAAPENRAGIAPHGASGRTSNPVR